MDTLIVQLYFPTSREDDDEIEVMFEEIEKLLMIKKIKHNVLIIGDFNAITGSSWDSRVVGKFGLDEMNGIGQNLIELCKKN